MIIKKLEVEDIAKILWHNHDDSGKFDKGQWIQFLMQHANNKNFLICGRIKDKKIDAYVVAMFRQDKISLLYISDQIINDNEFKKITLDWAFRTFGLSSVSFFAQGQANKWEMK